MSYPEHLICINKHYYYRISIPVDLKQYFPVPVIQKTLRTTNIKDAKPLLLATEYKVQRTFALLRSGMLPADTARLVVEDIVPNKQKAAVVKAEVEGRLLSKVIKQYVAEKESGWTAKSKMEFASVFKLLVDLVLKVHCDSCTLT